MKDLTGQKFGRLTVIKRVENKCNRARWLCFCECGEQTVGYSTHILNGIKKSCGCFKLELIIKMGKDNILKGEYEAAFNRLYSRYKYKANTRNLEFNLSKENFKIFTQQDCFYCGVKPNQITRTRYYGSDYIYNGIDRKDNNIGYILDNCVSCCKVCNTAKNSMSYNDFINWITRIKLHKGNYEKN